KAFISPETNIVTDGEGITHSSAHANFFALAFGLVPDKNIKPVLDHLHIRGMACSVYGSQFLLDGLFAAGDADYAIKLITSNEKRSWSNMLREGATMTMEAWGQEYKPNQDWGHAWGAAPANVIARHIVGIKPLKPAFEEFEIKPQIGKLQDLRYKHPTSRGAITVKIMHDSTMLQLDAEIPKGTKAQIYLPFNSSKGKVKQNGKAIKTIYQTGYFVIKNITAGKYSFEVQ
ncbi:MAG: alpha-L-rhamnosidase, partial [Chitinophagaceae bacterium]